MHSSGVTVRLGGGWWGGFGMALCWGGAGLGWGLGIGGSKQKVKSIFFFFIFFLTRTWTFYKNAYFKLRGILK